MQTESIKVYWKGKFNGEAVTIDKETFNPKLHRRVEDGAWPSEAPQGGAVKPSGPPQAQK